MLRRCGVAASAILLLALVGCSFPSDYYGVRAVDYNREAEQATQQALLLNIVRASLRRPMQFTGLQSVTGTSSTSLSANGSGGSTSNNPFSSAPSNTVLSSVVTRSIGATGTISGGPTFTVPVLDTQEFYQGILTPVPLQVIDFYLQEGLPPELIFNLFVSKVVVTRIDDGSCTQFTFENTVASDLRFGQFEALADYLISSGLSAERISKATSYGPALHPASKASAGDLAKTMEAYAKAAEAGLSLTKEKNGQYSVEKKSSELRSCFTYYGGPFPDWLHAKDKSIFCGQFKAKGGGGAGSDAGGPQQCEAKNRGPVNYTSTDQGVTANGLSEFKGIALPPAFLQRIAELQKAAMESPEGKYISDRDLFPVSAFRNAHVSFKFHTRSTEAILYYLGEIVRRQLSPEHGGARMLQANTWLQYGTYPNRDCNGTPDAADSLQLSYLSHDPKLQPKFAVPYRCDNIFVLDQGLVPGHDVDSVFYAGANYSIPADRTRAGRTAQVLEIVKQVLALNTSAKQLPSTTVISVVGAQ